MVIDAPEQGNGRYKLSAANIGRRGLNNNVSGGGLSESLPGSLIKKLRRIKIGGKYMYDETGRLIARRTKDGDLLTVDPDPSAPPRKPRP